MGTSRIGIKMLQLLAAISLLSLVRGECPRMSDIPAVLSTNETIFTCARIWEGEGHEQEVSACNGKFREIGDMDHTEGNSHPMGTIIVKPGCKLSMWKDFAYQGEGNDFKEILGPKQEYKNTFGAENADDSGPTPLSYICRCMQQMPDCVAEDKWDPILYCNNVLGTTDTTCSYSQAIGNNIGETFTNDIGIDIGVNYAVEAGFWEIFSESLGISADTTYDWSHMSSSSQSKTTTITVSAVAPAGLELVMEQAVGTCGPSSVRTEMFKTSHRDPNGKVVFEGIHRK